VAHEFAGVDLETYRHSQRGKKDGTARSRDRAPTDAAFLIRGPPTSARRRQRPPTPPFFPLVAVRLPRRPHERNLQMVSK
jgi:hypothetical protein